MSNSLTFETVSSGRFLQRQQTILRGCRAGKTGLWAKDGTVASFDDFPIDKKSQRLTQN